MSAIKRSRGVTLLNDGIVSFDYTKLQGGVIRFLNATLTSGTLTFREASVCGTEVDLSCAKFEAATVDFGVPNEWSVPPIGIPEDAPGVILPQPAGCQKPIPVMPPGGTGESSPVGAGHLIHAVDQPT